VTPAAIRVAAGAAETLPVARVTNLARFVETARQHGWWSYATVVDGGEPLDRVPFSERAILVLGSERRGVRPGVRDVCDAALTLPIDGVESLNVSVAAGIFVWEWAKHVAGADGVST
jgi:23S rRNA (guanosine2251-2'-O)-methyltransferase